MTQVLREATIDNRIMRIVRDEKPITPREWDNLGTMICWHRRYNLGDKHESSIEEFRDFRKNTPMVILPLYLLDHSGLIMRNTSFNDPWDSGQVGYIYATYEKIRKEYNRRRITGKLIRRVKEILRSETETFNQYLTGDVYGFVLVEVSKCDLEKEHEETLDSCFGFFGHDFETNGILDYVGQEWRKAEWREVN